MKYCSKKILLFIFDKTGDRTGTQRLEKLNTECYPLSAKAAFSLVEVVVALLILAFISSSVLVVINRYMSSAADSVLRMQAFEVARTNMENLLTADSATDSVEFGTSERCPDIEWETTVETFYEPLTSRMWVQAVCSAEYIDSEGEVQTIELTHWLTDVTKSQLLKLLEQQQDEMEQLADQVIETVAEAMEYAGVDEQTLELWIDNGMLTTKDGYYIKGQLDLYMNTNGMPTVEDKRQQAKADAEILKKAKEKQIEQDKQIRKDEQVKQKQPLKEIIPGYTEDVFNKLPPDEQLRLLTETLQRF